ncbi:intraflagellar transport protein 20 homolog [Maniola jurtina]|uniref:intraflagellar transport protein 20 homolog n=1 Tax=Maniola jurtina TaxID=191418 RepID=UPI001E68C7A0|nr:intraflagellar transport protein 20 homolog [Maniola jurtina]XP_045785783.1 intraflagellar transport protein 20 homolog [Maniola jurtina]XP_045785784.1 intraflagellar transport protein 20 homolog [Maniola jurtina]XP_045785785.1 intraflagellar transport protein 20 homolog [Maniola jurtina]
MAEELQKSHLYYDEINKIRVIENTVLKETEDLKETSKEYETKVQDFGKIITNLLDMLKELGDNVEKQKMAAIGATNLVKSIAKDRESEQAKLQAEISDKSIALEQLDSEYDALQILEATQIETIEYLTQLR